MDTANGSTAQFQAQRAHLRAVAYRMLGSLSDADNAVQETWLRLSRSDADDLANLGGWLTTVVSRICLDMLRSRSARQEEPLGEHLPDPVVSSLDGDDPGQEAAAPDSVGLALLVVLDKLSPCRTAGVRAARHLRRAVRAGSGPSWTVPRPPPSSWPAAPGTAERGRLGAETAADPARQRAVLSAFLAASRGATSRACSRCSTRPWCSGPTPAPAR